MKEHHLPVQRTARFFTLGEITDELREVWFVCHGYGQLARYFLRNFDPIADKSRLIIAPEALHPHHSLIDADYMAWAKSAGYAVNTWTVNEVEEAHRLANLGVDVIMTDGPDRIMAGL